MSETMRNKIHVLLVEHDMNYYAQTVSVLECFSYLVTRVQLASEASTLLSAVGHPFDLLIQNVNSPDTYGYTLLTEAVKMELTVILLVDEEDCELTKSALENGVFLCMRRPVSQDMAKYLWQYVAREKIGTFLEDPSIGYYESAPVTDNPDDGERADGTAGCFRKKVWTEWTPELHDKFMSAVRFLGEGRCYPADILVIMNVPGLTRMQVASHLQKCRTGSWKLPNDRRSRVNRQRSASAEPTTRTRRKRFGCMPNVTNNNNQTQQNTPFTQASEPNMGIGEWGFQSQEGLIHFESQDQNGYNPMNHVGIGIGVDAFSTAQLQMPMHHAADERFEFPIIDYSVPRMQYSGSMQGMDLDQTYFNQAQGSNPF